MLDVHSFQGKGKEKDMDWDAAFDWDLGMPSIYTTCNSSRELDRPCLLSLSKWTSPPFYPTPIPNFLSFLPFKYLALIMISPAWFWSASYLYSYSKICIKKDIPLVAIWIYNYIYHWPQQKKKKDELLLPGFSLAVPSLSTSTFNFFHNKCGGSFLLSTSKNANFNPMSFFYI